MKRPTARLVRVSFCCNNPNNGVFEGRACAAEVSSAGKGARRPWSFELEHDDWGRGVRLSIDEEKKTLRINRASVPLIRRQCWLGNWCWDGFVMERPEAFRLLQAMRRSGGWQFVAGPVRLSDWWDGAPAHSGAQQPERIS